MANADDLRNLAEEMVGAYEDRVASLSALRKETARLLNTFQKEDKERHREAKTRADEVTKMLADLDKVHKEMSTQLKATLAEVKPALEKDETDRVAQTQTEIKARVDEVTKMLADFDKAHKEMSTQLKATLAEVKPALEKDEADRVAQAQAEIKARMDEVKAKANETIKMLADFRSDQAKTAAAWQDLVKAMEAKRKAKPVVEKAVPKVKEEVKVVEEVAVEEVKEIPAEKPLEEKVLSLIHDNPRGIKLTAMEETLGVPRIKLGGIARSLLDADKIRKEGLLYFPKEKK